MRNPPVVGGFAANKIEGTRSMPPLRSGRNASDELGEQLVEAYGPDGVLDLIGLCWRTPHEHRARPCSSAGKIPVLGEWPQIPGERRLRAVSPTRVARQLAEHYGHGGNLGRAIPLGVVVLDADSADAAQRLSALVGPDAPQQETARGLHAWQRLPDGVRVTNRAGVDLEPGLRVDVRGYGGQVVVWPSIHAATGCEYTWQVALPHDLRELPLISQRWLERLTGRRSTPAPSTVAIQSGELAVHAGCRNAYLYGISRSLRARGLSAQAVAAAVRAENLARCSPPLDAQEVDALLRNAAAQPHRADFGREGSA